MQSVNTELPGGMQSVQTAMGMQSVPAMAGISPGQVMRGLRRADTAPYVGAPMSGPEGNARVRAPSVESARTVENVEPLQMAGDWTVVTAAMRSGSPTAQQSPFTRGQMAMQPPPSFPAPQVVPQPQPVYMPPPSIPVVPLYQEPAQLHDAETPYYNIATPGQSPPHASPVGSWASEREALVATKKQVGENWRLHCRDLLLALTGASMFVSVLVLGLTHHERGYSVDRNPIRPGLPFGRPGTEDNCHNLWVWLATLVLLDATHFLLHFLEEQVGQDPGAAWFTRAIDVSDHGLLALRVAASWYGVFLVVNVGGFILVAVITALVGVLLTAGVVLVGLAHGKEYAVGVGLVGAISVVTVAMVWIVDRASHGTCKGLLHTWAMMLASVYAISLAAALLYLVVVGRDEWTRRVKPRIAAAVEKFRQYTPQEA